MSDEVADKHKKLTCGCERELWHYSCKQGFNYLAIFLTLTVCEAFIVSREKGSTQAFFLIIFFAFLTGALKNLLDMVIYVVLGQRVYQFEDVNGRTHTHLTAPAEFDGQWYYYYVNEFNERHAIKIRHFILQLRNRGIFRSCSFVCTDDREYRWKKIQAWTPDSTCQLLDDLGRSVGRLSTTELLVWMNGHYSAQGDEDYMNQVIDTLGIGVSVVIERSNRERNEKGKIKSEVGRRMRVELEQLILKLHIWDDFRIMSSLRRARWADQATAILDAEAKAAEQQKQVEEQPV